MDFLNKIGKLLKTKTFWVNFLMAALVIIPRMAELTWMMLSAEMTSFIILIVNTILRWITKKPLEEK